MLTILSQNLLVPNMEHQSSPTPHVLIFPLPVQGHVTPMLHLAELLCLAKFSVTFLNTTHNHQHLTRNSNIEAHFASYPGFGFRTIPNIQPDESNNVKGWLKELIQGLALSAKPLLREIFVGKNKVTCMIIDGWMSFANDVANEAEVPLITFRCCSSCCIWSYFCIPNLIEAGEIPFKENEEMDQLVKNAPGMDGFLRYRDLPSFCRGQNSASCRDLQDLFTGEARRNQQGHSMIINTFEDLEGLTLSHIRSKCSKVYSIGPLHAHLIYRLGSKEATLANNSRSSLWEVDRSCISWLDQKPDKSVVYVSFGSLTTLTKDQLMEFWAGLVQSKKYFLWVIRPNLIIGNDPSSPTKDELLEGTKKRGYMVEWAPQDEVLAHRAVGGFLTHSGWNSILESIMTRVPMLCWPYFADQQVNSRFVSEVWKIGLDMKDTCDRTILAKMVNDLMDGKRDELQRSIDEISNLAKKSISEGGSSYTNFNQLIEEIKFMDHHHHHHHQSLPSIQPHVLIFPVPLQGHVTPMLQLAELFCLSNLKVTFLITTQTHQLLTRNNNIETRFARYPGFQFKTIPECPLDNRQQQPGSDRSLKDKVSAIVEVLALSAKPLLRELLFGPTKITCFVIDGWLGFAYDIANEAQVPTIAFRCSSGCSNWAYFCIPQLIEAGEVPFKDNQSEMDQLVKNVPGMDGFLRCRDLPSFCRGQDTSSCSDLKQFFINEIQRTKHSHAILFNTFEDLEGPILSIFRSQCSNIYTIGPLHAHLHYRRSKEETPSTDHSSSSLLRVDRGCISWLDQKPDKSVIFVSFGSSAKISKDQLMEFWAGLVQSKKYFLWVIRPDLLLGNDPDSPTPDEFLEGTERRGCIVQWAPQDEVLAHRAIGGFLTHSGWNSTIESIMAGVPMLCWSFLADQQINSRYVSEVWRIGLDMKDTCDRMIVEKMTNDLMDGKREELQRSVEKLSSLAKKSITEGGSSYSNLNHLIEDIKAMPGIRKL
ncbi:7-deoxyloganetic acid glucosyltransferase [Bienertia sinuspersici]